MSDFAKDTNVPTNDLISRRAAIAEFSCCELTPDGGIDANYAIDFLAQLPSAQPEIIRCKDCKHCFVDGEKVLFNVCELNHNKVQGDDWFCADAERREE